MDGRSWPWKKKTSEKKLLAADSAPALFSNSTGTVEEKDDKKSEKYVQITEESYTYFSGMEDQVKTLNEKLLTAQSEMMVKGDLVKQHAKVAEEAVSGWEKAEAEALALKQELDSVTLLKLTAEERSSHLDGALKECMKQIRDVKEESSKKLQDVVFSKTKQWEIIRTELEAKISDFERDLLKASAENSALSRSLQECSSLLMKVSEEKSQADAQIEVFKNNIQSCEREINSMEYEFHVVTKEIEIRKEERNMSMRSAEVANKQHLEDVKNITKLEAECQKLRGLVRKKLPGPAALAQMKEVKNMGREFGDNRLSRFSAKSSNPFHVSPSDLALENVQHVHEENEFLTTRLLAMEEEMKMLKVVLSNRNSELQSSRKKCAKQTSKLRSMEAYVLHVNNRRSPSKFNIDHFDNASNPPSVISMSEDGIDEEMSCSDSWANALISELSHFKRDKDFDNGNKADNSNQLELMDDFIEMERLACLSTYANNNMNVSYGVTPKMAETPPSDHSQKGGKVKDQKSSEHDLSPKLTAGHASEEDYNPLLKLKSRITSIFESQGHETNMKKVLEDIGHIIRDTVEELPQHYFVKEGFDFAEDMTEQKHYHKDICEITDVGFSLRQVGNTYTHVNSVSDQELKNAISCILNFLVTLGKEDEIQDTGSNGINEISKKMEEISNSIDRVICKRESLHDFVLHLTHMLRGVIDLRFEMGTLKCNEGENNGADCIDKETLLENKVTQHEPVKQSLSGVSLFVSHSSSFPDVEGLVGAVSSAKNTLPALSLKEFEDLKLEKEKVEMDLARCKEVLDQTKCTLIEVEQQLSNLRSELTSCQKSNSLAETQLKCMTESYKMLESRKDELEAEIGLWHAKAETLDNELQVERCNHLEHIVKYNELQEQIQRNMKCSTSSFPSEADNTQTQQKRDIAAAAVKLTECQETIILLSRQLHAMRNPAQPMDSFTSSCSQLADYALTEETNALGMKSGGLVSPWHFGQLVSENLITSGTEQSCRESPLNGCNSNISPSEYEPKSLRKTPMSSEHHKQKVCSSTSSKSGSEKHGRGFRKLFSRGKSER